MDARIKTEEGRLKLRASGIIIHDDKILIEKYGVVAIEFKLTYTLFLLIKD